MKDDNGFRPGLPFVESFAEQEDDAEASSPPAGLRSDEIIAEAKEEAERIVRAAHEQALQIRQSAHTEMQQQIDEAVEAEVRAVRQAQTEVFQKQARQLVEEFQQAAEDSLARLTRQVAAMVSAIVEKVVYRKTADDDEIVLDVMEEALGELTDATTLTVTVHPDEAETVDEHREILLQTVGNIAEIRIVKDNDMQRGGCLLDSDAGEVDARVPSRLAAIWKAISTHQDSQEAA
ncbi:MAG: FliH/SctL family protein [Armatimonadota bacterium]